MILGLDRHDLGLVLCVMVVTLGIAAIAPPAALIFAGLVFGALVYLDGRPTT